MVQGILNRIAKGFAELRSWGDRIPFFFILFFFLVPRSCWSEVTKGIFGVPAIRNCNPSKYLLHLKQAGINTVFVPPDRDTVRWFKEHGFKVYISVNVFGGRGAWKRYPDSRPVRADGKLLGSDPAYKGHGGVCPTHHAWRKERLKYIEKLVEQFGSKDGIDGIWLDFIRYPGLWEVKDPRPPDTCYCPRCLRKFQQDTGIRFPRELRPREAPLWIRKNCLYEWMEWKKSRISSFVDEVRRVLGHLKLGVFLVPWTKGEKQDAISYRLAQDPFQLSDQTDVISPMLYHRMCAKDVSWVGYMTRYYKETARCQVWPIVQSAGCSPEEFSNALKLAGRAGAGGILVFSFKWMKPSLWKALKDFKRPVNLITNPGFYISEGSELPTGWYTGKSKGNNVKKTTFFVRSADKFRLKNEKYLSEQGPNCIGILSGNDGAGVWFSRLPDCEPGVEYIFTCQLYREQWENGVYPYISIWGQKFCVNNHWLTRTFQPIRIYITCPERIHDQTFRFINHNPEKVFWLKGPRLVKNYSLKADTSSSARPSYFYEDFFPIGVYGANIHNLEQIKSLAINTVLISARGEELKRLVQKCHRIGLRYVLSVPRDPDRLYAFLDEIAEFVRPCNLAFYVNDEPGIHSFPINKANDINQLIKERFPKSATCMAVVRPQVCRDYLSACDFFMMDQYPIPYMPMVWLSDSMDRAARDAGPDRLVSVIQAFGGKEWGNVGWPRMPTWQEMDCLAFLSVVHGSRGIFFFTFKEIGKTPEGRQALGRVVGRLNRLYPWLLERNLDCNADVEMVSRYKLDPTGRPAIHCCLKKKGDQILLICVNTIGTHVEAVMRIGNFAVDKFQEVFSGVDYPVIEGGVRAKFKPFEVKAFVGDGIQDSRCRPISSNLATETDE